MHYLVQMLQKESLPGQGNNSAYNEKGHIGSFALSVWFFLNYSLETWVETILYVNLK